MGPKVSGWWIHVHLGEECAESCALTAKLIFSFIIDTFYFGNMLLGAENFPFCVFFLSVLNLNILKACFAARSKKYL